MDTIKKFSILNALILSLAIVPAAKAEIQCPMGWVKEVKDSVVVCVAQSQNQNQVQEQNNNQNQNVNQNVKATGGSSSSSSSSSSDTDIRIDNTAPAPIYVPQVVYTAPSKVVRLPATGLPEAGLALSALLPAGFALRKFAFKKSESPEESAASIWLEKQSSH